MWKKLTCLWLVLELQGVTVAKHSNYPQNDLVAHLRLGSHQGTIKQLTPDGSLSWESWKPIHHEAAKEPAQQPIVQEVQHRKWWGFPNYERDLDFGLRTWEKFAREHGHLGQTCSAITALQQCGTEFVCSKGTCIECQISRDCGEKFRCEMSVSGRKLCIPRDLRKQWGIKEMIATVLIILTAMLSAAAGMGGGGVFVPLLLLLLGLSTKEAVPLSQAMIFGGAIVNILMFCGDRHPKCHSRPKIDYEVVMMLNPGLAAGVTVGVICNIISPQWLIVSILLVTLVLALYKSLDKGISSWKKENKLLAEQAALAAAQPKGGKSAGGIQIKRVDFRSFAELAALHHKPMALVLSCWVTFLILNIMKPQQCTTMYWLQLLGMVLICAAFTYAGSMVIKSQQQDANKEAHEGALEWTPTNLWLYPILSTTAGFLGGFLGIGGGIIMGPLMMELGMLPEVNQATTAMFVFLSSSLASVQFVILGKTMPQYVMWFTTWVLLATIVGQTLVDYLLKRWKRASIIVFSIAGITGASLVMMTLIGVMDIVNDLQRGAYMGFSPLALCMT